jgi:signal transduction histidine kinase
MSHKNGTKRDVEISSLLMEYNGQPMYLSVYYDITERKRNEKQILGQNQLLRLLNSITLKIQTQVDIDQILTVAVEETRRLLDTCRVGIYKFDADWNGSFVVESARSPAISILHQTVNDSCFREYHLDKYLRGHISQISDVQNSTQILDCHRQLLTQFHIKANIVSPIVYGGRLWGLLIVHQCNAPRHWQELEVDLIRQISNHVAIAIQQTELTKNLEQQVADRTSELEAALAKEKELGELKTRFISMTSHEFRTPLATIQAASDLLLNYGDKMPAHKRNDRLVKIQREVKKMAFLLEEVLTMGRANAGKLALKVEAMDVHQFAKDCLEQAHHAATPEHHLVVTDEWSGAPEFYCDRHLLEQAVVNLLLNAIKYSPQGGHICLCVQGSGSELCLKIRDNGIGIPPEELPHIFESFYRAQNVGNISGTGLGLAIAHAVVELHHGTITVDSVESQGTTFTVTIPDQRTRP